MQTINKLLISTNNSPIRGLAPVAGGSVLCRVRKMTTWKQKLPKTSPMECSGFVVRKERSSNSREAKHGSPRPIQYCGALRRRRTPSRIRVLQVNYLTIYTAKSSFLPCALRFIGAGRPFVRILPLTLVVTHIGLDSKQLPVLNMALVNG